MAFLLPHELLAALARNGDAEVLHDTSHLDASSRTHLLGCVERVGGGPVVPLGLWGDGAPCNWDRTESLELLSLNLPGQGGRWRTLRLPLTGLSRRNVAPHTFDDLIRVLVWSLEALAAGCWPRTRHDGGAWLQPADGRRARRAGQPLGTRAALVEVRGDWKFLKETFKLPGWNTLSGICWRCSCTPEGLRQVGLDAPWRQEPLDHWGLLARMLRDGVALSPIWSAPWVRSSIFKIDWLHAVDQGVSADFLGNLFWSLLAWRRLPGATQGARCGALWALMDRFYREHDVADRLQGLQLGMLRQPNASPRLRGSAAQVRALVPFAAQLAASCCRGDVPAEAAAREGALALQACYAAALSQDTFNREVFSESCRRFAALLVALEGAAPEGRLWRVKPKLHLFLELSREHAPPSLSWTYRDEDFGGSMAALARRRGGMLRPAATSAGLLRRFMMAHGLPRLVAD